MTKPTKKETSARRHIEPAEAFVAYQERIVTIPPYCDIPDLRNDDGTIQWTAPSNRGTGKHRDTHVKRLHWWEEQAHSLGISTDDKDWKSKTARELHPTKQHVCQACGSAMDVRYVYLRPSLIKRIEKRFPVLAASVDSLTTIQDFVRRLEATEGQDGLDALPVLLDFSSVPKAFPPTGSSCDRWLEWVENVLIRAEPRGVLGPGVMANPPDRLDGFHSLNQCCRKTRDKGRSDENMASYGRDRRAYENWSEGNLAQADALYRAFDTAPDIRRLRCEWDDDSGTHTGDASPDHIGPLALGFTHRAEYQPLCQGCNSSKRDRLRLSDVRKLRRAEKRGEQVASWYLAPVWHLLEDEAQDEESTRRLWAVIRDNRQNAFLLLGRLLDEECYVFLCTLLSLESAENVFDVETVQYLPAEGVVRATFTAPRPQSATYCRETKADMVRTAFGSLLDYRAKGNRHEYNVIEADLLAAAVEDVRAFEAQYPELHGKLTGVVEQRFATNPVLRGFVDELPTRSSLADDPVYQKAWQSIQDVMESVALELASQWDSPRYVRDIGQLEAIADQED